MDVMDYARRYLDAGVSLLPVALDGTKRPAGDLLPREPDPARPGQTKATWKPYQSRLATEDEAWRWWGGPRPAGLAALCGAVSGGLELIDFDLQADLLFPAWRAMVSEAFDQDLLARLCVVRTPREPAGFHVWFRWAGPVPGSLKLAKLSAEEQKAEKERAERDGDEAHVCLIETKGEGGYALLPGCPPPCHPSGRPYVHLCGPALWELEPIAAEEREAVLAFARSLNREEADPEPIPRSKPGLDLRPGDDFDQRGGDWADILEPHGWTLAGRAGGERRWARPGKKRGWSATTGHCVSGGADLLRVFTSNADGFEEGKAYGKFRAFAVLNHGGNLSEAAKALRGQGFGSTTPHHANGAAPKPPPPDAPIDLTPEAWPQPPAPEAFHGLAGDVARAIDPQTEADPVAVLAQFLVAFGSAVGRNGHCSVGKRRHYPNLFAVMVGPTAKGRKGTAWDWVESLFGEAEPRWASDCIQTGLSSGEGLISAVRDPQKRRRKGGDEAEPEDDAPADKRLLAVEEEFGATLRVMGRDGNILSAVIRQAWDGGRLRTLTRNNPLRATDAHVGIIGHVTRTELVRLLRETDQSNGFANRFLWFASRRSKLLPEGGLIPSGWGVLVRRLREAVARAKNAHVVTRTPEAARRWREEYPRLTADRPGAVGLVTSRAEAQVLRLSLVYALLDGSDWIAVEHLSAALALFDYVERSCLWAFGLSTGSADADEILASLSAAGEQGMTGREVHALFHNHRTAAQVKQALAVLVDGGLAETRHEQTGGRPSQRWYVVQKCEQSEQSVQSCRQRTYGDNST